MKIKILFDPEGFYGYGKDAIIDAKQLVEDFIDTLNEVECADVETFLKKQEIEKAVDFVAAMWGIDYEYVTIERLAILDHETHTLFVEDVSEEALAKYDGDEQAYIEDNYALEDYSWDYIVATVYTAPDGEITTGVDFAKQKHDTRTCAVCGKQVTQGYLFDGTTCLCSKECATHFFADDEGCVEILIDEADRLKWNNEF